MLLGTYVRTIRRRPSSPGWLSYPTATGRRTVLSRLYGDPIEVWTRDGSPVRFGWRDRRYTVRQVLEHWVVAREWWKTSDADPGARRFWRVVASPGGETGTYELRYDTSTDRWLLLRAWD